MNGLMRGFQLKKIPDVSLYPIVLSRLLHYPTHGVSSLHQIWFFTEICPNLLKLSASIFTICRYFCGLSLPVIIIYHSFPSNNRSALIIIPHCGVIIVSWVLRMESCGPKSGSSFKLKLLIDLAFLIILLASSLPFYLSWSSCNMVFIGKMGTSAGGAPWGH